MTARCTCGIEFEDTASGRWRHRLILSHSPTKAPERPVIEWPELPDEGA